MKLFLAWKKCCFLDVTLFTSWI